MENKNEISKPYNVGYALSGGFIKGFAHLGVIQALLENDIKPQIISGVSAGALAGAFYADGNEPYKVLDFFRGHKFQDLTKLVIPTLGFFELSDLIDFIASNLKTKKLEEFPIPLVVTATDFDHGHSVHFKKGNAAELIAASCCMPVVFKPLKIGNTHYVDGGILMNLPVHPIRHKCEKVVAINLCPLEAERFKMNLLGVALRSYHLLFSANSFTSRDIADLLIEPCNLSQYSMTKLEKADEIFDLGYKLAKEEIENLKQSNGTIWRTT